jgi:uncharacterized phage protein (predicted DNA packaging)
MIMTLEEAKKWIRVDTNEEDTLIESFIRVAEDIVTGILRYPLSDFEEIPEPVKHAVFYSVSRFYEERESLNIVSIMETLRGMLFSYRNEAF